MCCFLSSDKRSKATKYCDRKRPIIPANYIENQVNRKRRLIDSDFNKNIEVKLETVGKLKQNINILNQYLLNGESCDLVDLTAEDVYEYERAYNSEEEEMEVEDEGNIDTHFSGNHKFTTDVSKIR